MFSKLESDSDEIGLLLLSPKPKLYPIAHWWGTGRENCIADHSLKFTRLCSSYSFAGVGIKEQKYYGKRLLLHYFWQAYNLGVSKISWESMFSWDSFPNFQTHKSGTLSKKSGYNCIVTAELVVGVWCFWCFCVCAVFFSFSVLPLSLFSFIILAISYSFPLVFSIK